MREISDNKAFEPLGLALPTLLISFSRAIAYGLAGLTGIILARALGPEGRGLYSLVIEAAGLVYAPFGLGIATAGVYLWGQRKFDLQTVFSNTLAWLLTLFAAYGLAAALLLSLHGPILGLTEVGLAIGIVGGGLGLLRSACSDFLAGQGRMGAVAASQLLFPVVRLAGTAILLVASALTTDAALMFWLLALYIEAMSQCWLIGKRLRLLPKLHLGALRQQLSFSIRGHLGWILQSLNYRLDVFLVGYFVGIAGVGYYAVAFNLAEITWWMTIALGIALFPRVSALDPKSNAELSAEVLRKALVITAAVTALMLLVGQPLIRILYGTEFKQSVTPFLILVPSGILYTIHKVLNISLAAQGRPQAGLYGGLVSVPVMVGLNLILIPRLGIAGAALSSVLAYAINATFMACYFVRITRVPFRKLLVITKEDLIESVQANNRFALRLFSRIRGSSSR